MQDTKKETKKRHTHARCVSMKHCIFLRIFLRYFLHSHALRQARCVSMKYWIVLQKDLIEVRLFPKSLL